MPRPNIRYIPVSKYRDLVAKFRTEQGWTLREMAEILGVEPGTLSSRIFDTSRETIGEDTYEETKELLSLARVKHVPQHVPKGPLVQVINRARQQHGWTNKQMHVLFGLPQSTFSSLFYSRRTTAVTRENAERILRAIAQADVEARKAHAKRLGRWEGQMGLSVSTKRGTIKEPYKEKVDVVG